MSDNGFVKIHRSILTWEWYGDINTTMLFIHLLLKANHEDAKWEGKIIKRGELSTTIKTLSEESGLTVQSIRTAIKKLKSTNEITSTSTNKYTLINVVKYGIYQDVNDESNMPTNKQSNKRTTNEQQTGNKRATNKNNKKVEENIPDSEPSHDEEANDSNENIISLILNDGTEHFIKKSRIIELAQLYPAVDIMQELRNMKGWCLANRRQRKTKAGVDRFINTWLMKCQDKGGSSGLNFQRMNQQNQLDILDNLIANGGF